MSIRTQLITADELLRMSTDGNRRELVSGELRELTPAGHEHGRYTMRFSVPLGQHVEEHNLGVVYAAETGFQLATNPDTVRAPDIAFVSRERAASVSAGPGFFPGAPDLAVEVVSPSDTDAEVESKVEDWLRAGCRLVIVVNPRNQTLKTYRAMTNIAVLTVEDTLDAGDVVPGFRLPVRKVFPSN
jgi:Uma2 family endonuclease